MRPHPLWLAVVLLGSLLQPLDDAAREWVQSQRRPQWEQPMNLVSNRSRVVLVTLAVAGLVSGAAGRAAVLEGAVALVPVNLAVEGLKWSVGRTRPDGDRRRRNSAFPSSHSANAFAVATVIARRWRRWAVPAGAFAVLVAWSRMYLDRHWLTDVTGGALIGIIGTLLAVEALHRWQRARGAPPSA